MATERHKGKASLFHQQLYGEYPIEHWVTKIIVPILAFLLVRYINED